MAGGNVPANLAPIFRAAGQQYHIPPAILAGVASVETNLGQNRSTSSTGAVGLMQFEPGTAQSLGVNPLDDRSAIYGAAKLLNQYGYQSNPTRAIGAYNGGPGNPQYGYARQVMSEASRLGGQLGGGGGGTPLATTPAAAARTSTAAPSTTGQTFDKLGFQIDRAGGDVGRLVAATDSRSNPWNVGVKGANVGPNELLASGTLSTAQPDPANYVMAQSNLQALAGGTVLQAHPVVKAATGNPSNLAGGFLPQGARYTVGRRDQGRDGTTNPGGPILAPGAGYIVRIGSDPGGFGPRYPIVHFTTGPYAGRTMYLGHTLAAVTSGSFKPGQVLSYTGTHGVGNATVPGWFEIGFADGGSPGPMGQSVPF